MIESVFESASPEFRWIDVTDPSEGELKRLAEEHGLHPMSVEDCLDPEHLPKYERLDGLTFVIVRALDESAPDAASDTRALTRKLAVFFNDTLVLTVHRKPQPYLDTLKREIPASLAAPRDEAPGPFIAVALVSGALETYWKRLESAEEAIGRFEESLFDRRDVAELIQDVYRLKRQVMVIRWMVRHTREVILKLRATEHGSPAHQDLREHADALYFAADELLEDVNNLLNTQLSLAAHQTNQVMRILTIFSVFFMPLTFIVGVYGMNFQFMPELRLHYGYALAWLLMLATCAAVYVWFRRQGWMK